MTLYVHIPFCASKCGYCAFNSIDSHFDLQEEYVEALLIDLAHSIEGKSFTSVYFGGGTPNILHQKFYESIFELIGQKASLSKDAEITMECNPNLIQQSWCESLKSLGANRVSLGVQSFFEKKLEFLQRDHRSYDIFQSIEILKQSSLVNLSIDLIYNTPFDSVETLGVELERLKSLEVSHLSAYALSIDKGSVFYKAPPKLSGVDYSFELREMLGEIGFVQYEVSSYCGGHKSAHNLSYWRGEDYIGCGAGAVGCVGNVRSRGTQSVLGYIKNPLKKQKEILSDEQKRFERLFLGLRCEEGVSLDEVDARKAQILLDEQKCRQVENRLVALDFFLADEIALWLS